MAYSADLCGSKLRGKLGGVLNESAATSLLSSNNSFAKRQLEKMGWTEGTGLGKRRDGMKEHIKIKQREDEMGLGREKMKAMEVADVWWKDSVGDTLAKLQKRKSNSTNKDGKKEKKSKKKKKSDRKERKRHFTDEELFEATGGARFGMRAQRRAEGKWKRTESGEELLQQEKKARASMEWNGRGNAQVLISKETSRSSSSILEDEDDGETDVGTTKNDADVSDAAAPEEKTAKSKIKEEKQSKKKKKRKSEKKESKKAKKAKLEEEDGIHEVSPPVSEEEELLDIEEKKSAKKRSKKDKKKKSK